MATRQAKLVIGHTIYLREVVPGDAGFILDLRLAARNVAYISPTDDDEAKQIRWIQESRARGETYFTICGLDGTRLGTIRLYDARMDSIQMGSWIVAKNAPRPAAIESFLLACDYAINHMGFPRCHFEVRKTNPSVKFHLRFGAVPVHRDNQNFYFEITSEIVASAMRRFRRFLPSGITVADVRT